VADAPLLRRFPALARLPRAGFGQFPTAVERIQLDDGRTLLVKRDDLAGSVIGGNKVRGLEWLLGGVGQDDRLVTVGPRGSTHALATATLARVRGARTTVVRWDQVMHAAARAVDARMRAVADVIDARWIGAAYPIAALRIIGGARWIPAGGTTGLSMLGHVNAGLELAEQIARGECEAPGRVFIPLGTGGTAAGVALGLRLAGARSRVVAVRVVPRVLGRRGRVLALARETASMLEWLTGERVPTPGPDDLDVEHRFYGGGYAKPIATAGERALEARGIRLDDTYSRKAFAAAVASASAPALLWLTFDGRLLGL
jgi:D-cysteine desulfhydrase